MRRVLTTKGGYVGRFTGLTMKAAVAAIWPSELWTNYNTTATHAAEQYGRVPTKPSPHTSPPHKPLPPLPWVDTMGTGVYNKVGHVTCWRLVQENNVTRLLDTAVSHCMHKASEVPYFCNVWPCAASVGAFALPPICPTLGMAVLRCPAQPAPSPLHYEDPKTGEGDKIR